MRVLQIARILVCTAIACASLYGGEPIIGAQQVTILAARVDLPDAPEWQGGGNLRVSEQEIAGTVRGIVVDPAGAVIEGARVTLTPEKQSTGVVRETLTGGDGKFRFSDVPAGDFKLTTTLAGFATRVLTGVLQAGESLELKPVKLEIAATASDVSVTVSREDAAKYEVKAQEQQRVLGVIPNFYVSYVSNPVPLTPKLKFELAWKTVIDPVTFGITGVIAGVEQANNSFAGYGQGAAGYGKRYGAVYGDNFVGTMIGSAILPSLLKQDPRYFYKGTGSTRSRILYAIANSVICKGDNGHWQADYSAILGGLAAAGISNLYYPASSRNGAALTFENAAIGTAASAAANLLQEFLIRRLTPKAAKSSPSAH